MVVKNDKRRRVKVGGSESIETELGDGPIGRPKNTGESERL